MKTWPVWIYNLRLIGITERHYQVLRRNTHWWTPHRLWEKNFDAMHVGADQSQDTQRLMDYFDRVVHGNATA